MIRFRIGQRWKSERAEAPVDAFGLELDGVDILSGAGEESLLRVVPELVSAVAALWRGERLGQVSLSEAHLELVLERVDDEVDLEVVSLSRPARRLRGPIRVELEPLRLATVRAARGLMADLREHAPAVAADPELRELLRTLQAVETRPRAKAAGWGLPFKERHPAGETGFGFELDDVRGRLRALGTGRQASLGALLFEGEVELAVKGVRRWGARCHPFLAALELSRQASELVHALEVSDARFAFRPAGLDGELSLDLEAGVLTAGGATAELTGQQLSAAMFELGQGLCALLIREHKAHAKNPYVQELLARCRDGMLHLRAASPPPAPPGAAPASKRARGARPEKQLPLVEAGRLRRLRFEQRWSTEPLGVDHTYKLLLSKKGPVISAAELACGYTAHGRIRFRRAATRGVAVDAEGNAIAAAAERVYGYRGDAAGARWLRDHDGVPVGPELFREAGRWITTSQQRTLLAFSELTGRELWRIAPSRTQRLFPTVIGERAVVTTDGGQLYAFSLADGAVLYRVRLPLPFDAKVIAAGRRILGKVTASERISVVSLELETGALHWSRDLPLSRASLPLPCRDRIYVAGEHGGDALVFALDKKGEVAWERRLHLTAGPYSLVAVNRAVLVTARSGAAALVDSDGRLAWRVGAPSRDEVACDVAAVVSRGVAVIPGPLVRAVDARTGDVLTELKASPGLCDLRVDRSLGLYLLDEDGTLSAYRLATHLAVIEGR